MNENQAPYDYTTAGFDGFLSRSPDELIQSNLSSQGPVSTSIPFDRGQQSGSLGNIITIGSIKLDGVTGRISIYDGQNEVVRIGELDG